MAVFAGAVIKDKKWAFIIPVLSMFISDLLYQVLYIGGLTAIQGFYEGQWQNYILFTLLVFVGFAIKKLNVLQIAAASLAAPTVYFIVSNFLVWASNGTNRGLDRPKTLNGLMLCYSDGIPFYQNKYSCNAGFLCYSFWNVIISSEELQGRLLRDKGCRLGRLWEYGSDGVGVNC